MKIERLIGIIAVLQSHRKVTAPYLAERFEVSRRTINRDIEAICSAGIPVVTEQGAGGGISLMEGFALDRTVFTAQELQSILIGLKSIESVTGAPATRSLAAKLTAGRQDIISLADGIVIDLSSHYKESLAPKIESIQRAMRDGRLISFRYFYNKGEQDKLIEPYLIVFKWSSWYVFGFCTARRDFRMYKLNRLWDLSVTDHAFSRRDIPADKLDFDSRFPDLYEIIALFENSQKYRLIEEFGRNCFSGAPDGRLLFRRGFTDVGGAIGWLLGFGDAVEVLAPQAVRDELKRQAQNILKKYD